MKSIVDHIEYNLRTIKDGDYPKVGEFLMDGTGSEIIWEIIKETPIDLIAIYKMSDVDNMLYHKMSCAKNNWGNMVVIIKPKNWNPPEHLRQ